MKNGVFLPTYLSILIVEYYQYTIDNKQTLEIDVNVSVLIKLNINTKLTKRDEITKI